MRINVAILGFCLSGSLSAFEILSEGALDAVSAVSANSGEEILNVAGSPGAGLTEDYEELPFQTSISVAEDDRDEVQVELDFSLTQEVETWANQLRESGQGDFEVTTIDDVDFQAAQVFIDSDDFLEQDRRVTLNDEEGEDNRFRLGRLDREVERIDSGLDTIEFRDMRFIDRAETIAPVRLDEASVGSGFVTYVLGYKGFRISEIRE